MILYEDAKKGCDMGMDKLILGNKEFNYYEYTNESQFERDVVENANKIFGQKLYMLILKRE